MTQAIYKIINLVNDKFYVGSTTNKKVRFRQHRKLLRGNRHHCKHLQAAWNKYGEEKFDFRVVEDVPDGEDLAAAEDRWLREHFGKPHCYNAGAAAVAPWRGVYGADHFNFGRTMADEHKQQISKTLKEFYAADYANHPRVGIEHSDEAKAKISISKLANPTKHWLGKTRSEETKAKIGAAQRGKPKPAGRKVSEEGRAKIRANIEAGRSHKHWRGKTHTEETKEKMRRPIYAVLPDGTKRDFVGLYEAGIELETPYQSLVRACKSGKLVSKGKFAGWLFCYADQAAPVVDVPEEYKDLPRTRQQAKELGAKQYFTGIACERGHIGPRAVKGTCIFCRREDDKKARYVATTPENTA